MNALFSNLTTLAATVASESNVGGVDAPSSMTETVTEAAAEFGINPMAFVDNLKYMAAGMVGIFIVIGAIVLTIVLLGKLTAPRKKKRKENEQ